MLPGFTGIVISLSHALCMDIKDARPASSDPLPPLWMRPTDPSGRAVDERVVAACNRLWRWAYFHVESKLHDAPSAAELMEEVALNVSRRLQAEPAVERNLTGYLITAFHRRVWSQVLRNNRLVYEGLVRELEQNHFKQNTDLF